MLKTLDFVSIDLSIDASIIAQQLTLIAADLYNNLTLAECEVWQSLPPRNETPKQAPHINAILHHSDELRLWTLRTLESSTNQPREAAQVASRIIAIADGCLGLNNFSTLFSIVSALNEKSVQRPLMSLEIETRLRLTYLQELVSFKSGFWQYRQAIRRAPLPCVPFLGLTLTDLRYIEEGTPASKPDVKRQKTAEVWKNIQRFQSEQYPFEKDSEVQILIRSWVELSDPEAIEKFM